MNETVVAVVGNNALVLDTPEERDMGNEASLIERQALAMNVTNDLAYSAAGELLKSIKGFQKKITEYWEPLRQSAKKAYDDVLAKKKEMLDPVSKAEQTLKQKMGAYAAAKEKAAREEEERIRKAAQAEIERKLNEAAELEANGDAFGADFALAEAEVYDQCAERTTVKADKPSVKGVSTSKTWKIKSIDPEKVPVNFAGVELRPVDKAAVLRLVKASKGQISIPGVVIEEDVTISARA